jgi:hypothetical protein
VTDDIAITITVTMPNGDVLKMNRKVVTPADLALAGDLVSRCIAGLAEEVPDQKVFRQHRRNADGLTEFELDLLDEAAEKPVSVSYARKADLVAYASLAARGLVAPKMTLTSSHYELTAAGRNAIGRPPARATT